MSLKRFEESPLTGVQKCIGIMAGKGGVGKSTLTVNLAHALRLLDYKVGILDADIYGPSIKKMLNISGAPHTENGKIVPVESKNGIKVMSLALFKQGEMNNAVRAPIANSIIAQFIHDVDWGELDFLLIDFPPGTGDIQLTLMQQIQFSGALLISMPQMVSICDVEKALQMAKGMEIPILGVVENMSYFQDEENRIFGKSHIHLLETPLLGKIPLDPVICSCADRGESLFDVAPESVSANIFLNLAELLDHSEAETAQMITEIKLIDCYTFTLRFNDGKIFEYRMGDLQKICPCARCKNKERKVDPQVSAAMVKNVGRYAMKIDFTSGCRNGIFSYRFLRNYAEQLS
ncbi:MAG: P-loop NTPase [Simkaniaceae bacterium]|nr:P-loop NTPase [Simkaniaceae bacterium]